MVSQRISIAFVRTYGCTFFLSALLAEYIHHYKKQDWGPQCHVFLTLEAANARICYLGRLNENLLIDFNNIFPRKCSDGLFCIILKFYFGYHFVHRCIIMGPVQ